MLRTAATYAVRTLVALPLLLPVWPQTGLANAQWRAASHAEAAITAAQLPAEGQRTYRLILQGGPFAHDRDAAVFGNRERLLPPQRRGYYREYTVETPGVHGRGARRIVCGGYRPVAPDACWYTGDHYASFKRILQ